LEERSTGTTLHADPRETEITPPEQKQNMSGLTAKMKPKPDHVSKEKARIA
jgi:hypothetical protein